MADETVISNTPIETQVADAPAAPSPTPAPSSTPVVDGATASQPIAESTPAAVLEEVKVETAPTTVLGAEPAKEIPKDKAPEAKPEEANADGTEQKKEEGNQSVEPAPLPTYEAFKLPEGVTFEDEKLGEFTKELGELQLQTKADQAKMQEFGQKLVDRHIAETQNTIKRLNEHYVNTWEKQKTDWKEAFQKDPEIGGNRQETTVKAALDFIRTHGGNESQQQEFRQLMETTGIGNHPAMIRLLAKANMTMSEGKPLPASKPMPTATSKVAKRYGDNV